MKRSKKEIQRNWHPNFRVQEDLPDIKPIRTGFIINVIAVTLCLFLAYFLVHREFRQMALRQSIGDLNTIVQQSESANRRNIARSAEFAREVQKLQEVERFFQSPLQAYDFLLDLAANRPENLIYENITFREVTRTDRRRTFTTYQLSIGGQTRDLGTLDRFKEVLRRRDFVAAYNGVVNETIFQRNEQTGIFPYTIEIGLTPPE